MHTNTTEMHEHHSIARDQAFRRRLVEAAREARADLPALTAEEQSARAELREGARMKYLAEEAQDAEDGLLSSH